MVLSKLHSIYRKLFASLMYCFITLAFFACLGRVSTNKEMPHAFTSHKTEHTYTRGGRLKSLRSFWRLHASHASDESPPHKKYHPFGWYFLCGGDGAAPSLYTSNPVRPVSNDSRESIYNSTV